MCGLYGYQWHSADSIPREDKMIALLSVLTIANDKRGGDSWGYYVPEKDRLKRGLGSFAKGPGYLPFLKRQALLAHTRLASCGKVTKENAHPFRVGGTVGAHNGCVSNHTELNIKHDRKLEVDSLHLFHHLEEGLDLQDIEAYGAITFVQTGDKEAIHLGRFNDGELAIADVKKHGLCWSSTKEALQAALEIAHLEYELYEVKQGELYQAVQGVLYKTEYKLNFAPYRSMVRWDNRLYGSYSSSSKTPTLVDDDGGELCPGCGVELLTLREMEFGFCRECLDSMCQDCGEPMTECLCGYAGYSSELLR